MKATTAVTPDTCLIAERMLDHPEVYVTGPRCDHSGINRFVAAEAVALLAEVPLFAELEPAELELIAVALEERTFDPGAVVTVEGQPADGFFVIASGEAQVTVHGETVGTVKPGDYFGEIALLMGGERTATITAISELRCYGIAPTDFRPLVEGNPTIAWKLMGSMSEHLS